MAKALRRIVPGPNGKPMVIFVDAVTGQQISNMAGYEIIDQTPATALNSINVARPEEDKKETTAEKVVEETVKPDSGTPSSGMEAIGTGFAGRGPVNNFGYVNTPMAVQALGFAPGVLGLAGKAVNTGINVNNVAATNQARGMLGLEPMGFMDTAKGVALGSKGQVANVSLGPNNYSVGFEALSPTGRTSLTPNEARTRAAVLGLDIEETPKDEVKADEEAFADTGLGKSKGIGSFFSGIAEASKSLMESIFGPSPEDTSVGYTSPAEIGLGYGISASPEDTSVGYTSPAEIGLGYGISASPEGFPDAPSAPGIGSGNTGAQGEVGVSGGFGSPTGKDTAPNAGSDYAGSPAHGAAGARGGFGASDFGGASTGSGGVGDTGGLY